MKEGVDGKLSGIIYYDRQHIANTLMWFADMLLDINTNIRHNKFVSHNYCIIKVCDYNNDGRGFTDTLYPQCSFLILPRFPITSMDFCDCVPKLTVSG